MSDTFNEWPKERLSQLYFYDETPTTTICERYFKITDKDVLYSLVTFKRSCGKELTKDDIDLSLEDSISKDFDKSRLFKFKKKHKTISRLLRDLVWSFGKWKTAELNTWVDNCKPDVIYIVMSDYCFPTKVAWYLSRKHNIPIYTSFEDDFYFSANPHNVIEWLLSKKHKRLTRKVFKRSFGVSYASEVMKSLYESTFKKKGIIQYKSVTVSSDVAPQNEHLRLLYAGTFNFHRWRSLIEIGKAIEPYDAKLILFSNNKDEEITKELEKYHSIDYRGFASSEQIEKEIRASNILLVVESFDEESIARVKCSLSTKIADYLGANRCILAYGPVSVGSIDYLLKNEAAIVADESSLSEAINQIVSDPVKIDHTIENAKQLAIKNHDAKKIALLLKSELIKGIGL